MFMHMPKRLGIPVMIVVAACLAAYWWFIVAPVRVGEWEIYQGTGRLVEPEEGAPYADISYTVRRPAAPLFRAPLDLSGCDNAGGWDTVSIMYQSEWPTALRVVIYDNRGVAWETLFVIDVAERPDQGECWWTASLDRRSFGRVVPKEGLPGETPAPEGGLKPIIEFYDGSGVAHPSTRFSNRMQLYRPTAEQSPKVTTP